MFPRLPRLVRLALVVTSLSLSLLLLLKAAPTHRPTMVPSGSSNGDDGGVYPRRLPSPAFMGPLSSTFKRSRLVTVRRTTGPGTRPNLTVTAAAGATKGMGSALPEKDVVNPHRFRYLLNPQNACRTSDGGHAKLLVYVHAAPANLKKRQSIRETWGEAALLRRYNATLVFIMGSVQDRKLSELLVMEFERYGDIVQEDFVDSYRNLTYKAVAGLKWAASYCSQADYILKSDDDILVNIHRLVRYLREVVEPQYGRRRLILCNQWLRMKILRDKKSKWYIPEEEFPGDYFPPYCSGSAFLLSGDMARLMYEASLVTRFFWVDDYYITGALVKHLGLKHRRMNQAYSLNPSVAEGKYRNDTRRELFFFHLHKLRVLYGLWRNMTVAESGAVTTRPPALTAGAARAHNSGNTDNATHPSSVHHPLIARAA